MRIVLDATALGSGLGGDETYLTGMLEGLAGAARSDDVFPLLTRRGVAAPTGLDREQFPVHAMRRLPGSLHYTCALPIVLRAERHRADLVHAITHAPVRSPVPYALTVGDLSFRHFPEHYPRASRLRLNALVGRQCRRARVVCTPSEFSRRDVIEAYDLEPARVAVVPNRVRAHERLDDEARTAAEEWLCRRGVRRPFVLYLGNLHPRKNVPRLIGAYGRFVERSGADVQLVVAGARWWGAGDEDRAIASLRTGDVVLLGRVDDTVRRHLLETACALAYVSLYEGFGLPVIEAMAAGTAVVASDRASLPEVCGDAALLVDPYDIDAIAAGLDRIVHDDMLRTDLCARGRQRAARYDAPGTGAAAYAAFSMGGS